MSDLFSIISQFSISGTISDIVPIGSGHIHETYRVITDTAEQEDYVLQRLNTNVFRDPEAVMQNLRLVTSHIRMKLTASGVTDTRQFVLTPVALREGRLMFTDKERKVWRCFLYIRDHRTYDRAIGEEQVYEGGMAYGRFLQYLSDLPAKNIKDTIPGFHDLDLRLNQFEEARIRGLGERIAETQPEIALLRERKEEMRTILLLGKAGSIPLRIVHHDTKINNVLFGDDGRALCVIDLDTVMPGYVHDDFGDSIRTFTNTGEEDDADLRRVSMNIRYFEAFTRGFLEVTRTMLNQTEKDHLALAVRVMTYMQVLRFLADYLNGDTYYRIHHPGHNLQRARAQIKLLLSMEEQYGEMKRIIEELG
jgi:Ser/Thr protein kinase RdoA (MazF antagonist)